MLLWWSWLYFWGLVYFHGPKEYYESKFQTITTWEATAYGEGMKVWVCCCPPKNRKGYLLETNEVQMEFSLPFFLLLLDHERWPLRCKNYASLNYWMCWNTKRLFYFLDYLQCDHKHISSLCFVCAFIKEVKAFLSFFRPSEAF